MKTKNKKQKSQSQTYVLHRENVQCSFYFNDNLTYILYILKT